MAWSVDQIYSFVRYQIRKNQAGGISATDFFYAWNSEQSSYHEDLLGRWQNRSNGKTGTNTGLVQDSTMLLKLAPITLSATLNFTNGFAPWPTDLLYLLAMRVPGAKIYHFDKDERWSIEDSVIDPPDGDSCYFTEYGNPNQFFILPTTTLTAEIDYIAACRDIVWGFTFDSNNRQVYDSTLSVQPVWTQNTIVEISKRTLKTLGVSYKDQDFAQFGDSVIKTGD